MTHYFRPFARIIRTRAGGSSLPAPRPFLVQSEERPTATVRQILTKLIIPLVLLLMPIVTAMAVEPQRPNILWLTTEDLSSVLGCYGDSWAVTPTLDQLAAEGVRYSHAFASASVCTPARSSLITGIFASSLGTQHLRGEQPLPQGVRCFTEQLRETGYYCSNNVKEDYNFTTPEAAWDESSATAHWRKREPGQPFFSVFNFMTTHQSRVRFGQEEFEQLTARVTPDQRHDPAAAPLPPYYPDTPLIRKDIAQLYDLVTAMDLQVRDLLEQLEQDGLADNTIVFFYSDHGTGLPRHKRWLHDSGTRVPLIIRCPERYRDWSPGPPGSVTDRLVSFVDFAPTVLSVTGLSVPESMQGSAFLGPQSEPDRQFVVAIRDRVDEVYEMSRMIRDHRYQYIRNFMPHRPRMQHSDFSEQTATRQELRRLAADGQLQGPQSWLLSDEKPIEELYDTELDPHQMRNLADAPGQRETLLRMRRDLHAWMVKTRDTGLLPEVEMIARSEGRSPYDMARMADRFYVRTVLAAAERVGRGVSERDRLIAGLRDTDAAIRYWSAVGLAALKDQAEPARHALTVALEDDAANVRFTAAEVLCRLGEPDAARTVLCAGLESPDPVTRLYAAISLVAVGDSALPALPQMQAAVSREATSGTYPLYIRWALNYAIENLESDIP